MQNTARSPAKSVYNLSIHSFHIASIQRCFSMDVSTIDVGTFFSFPLRPLFVYTAFTNRTNNAGVPPIPRLTTKRRYILSRRSFPGIKHKTQQQQRVHCSHWWWWCQTRHVWNVSFICISSSNAGCRHQRARHWLSHYSGTVKIDQYRDVTAAVETDPSKLRSSPCERITPPRSVEWQTDQMTGCFD